MLSTTHPIHFTLQAAAPYLCAAARVLCLFLVLVWLGAMTGALQRLAHWLLGLALRHQQRVTRRHLARLQKGAIR